MFLLAETPHAYLNGVALEVMANSDDVLRAGLTQNTSTSLNWFQREVRGETCCGAASQPVKHGAELDFPIPVGGFAFSLHDLRANEPPLPGERGDPVLCGR
ncbi:hypothetical protein ACNKHS_09665 [Shigella flexneri]